jgi:hypothetical protein
MARQPDHRPFRDSLALAPTAGQRFGDIEHGVADAAGARGFPAKSDI